MARRDVSVVIPTYNYGRFVGRAVQSALDQTLPPVDVTVVDDGSTDDTAAVLEAFGPRVNVILQANSGVAAARNRGARASNGSLLAFLDADDVWHPDMLATCTDAFDAEPEAGAVHCGLEEVDEDGRVLGLRVDGYGGWVAEDLLLLKPVVPLTGSAAVVPRTVFESVGGYDEELSTSADWELCLRIAMRHPIAFVDRALVSYTVHGSNMHGNLAAMEHDVRRGFDKAFASSPALRRLRHRAMASLFMTLSGSSLAVHDRRRALEYGWKGVRADPSRALYALALPARRLRRRVGAGLGNQ